MRMFEGFDEFDVAVNDTTVFGRVGGEGPPLVMLHGFPETSAMWRDVAPLLADRFRVVCIDLLGYGRSGCPPSSTDHSPSKRAQAAVVVAAMATLGCSRFAIAGHDRGGRVAYRAALDHPGVISHLAVLDVVAIEHAWREADDRLALGFWPWSLLAQEPPLPERLIGGAADAVLNHALSPQWGTPADVFPASVRAEYLAQLEDPQHRHAICEEYRAAAGIDRDHDRRDLATARTIRCPTLALWSQTGPLATWYEDQGGPLGVWRELAPGVTGHDVPGGHFFPEEQPEDTAEVLRSFSSQ